MCFFMLIVMCLCCSFVSRLFQCVCCAFGLFIGLQPLSFKILGLLFVVFLFLLSVHKLNVSVYNNRALVEVDVGVVEPED